MEGREEEERGVKGRREDRGNEERRGELYFRVDEGKNGEGFYLEGRVWALRGPDG